MGRPACSTRSDKRYRLGKLDKLVGDRAGVDTLAVDWLVANTAAAELAEVADTAVCWVVRWLVDRRGRWLRQVGRALVARPALPPAQQQ